jgi:hypothetical protein
MLAESVQTSVCPLILEQCFDGDLVMVASPAHISVPRWAFQYVYQTAGYARGDAT